MDEHPLLQEGSPRTCFDGASRRRPSRRSSWAGASIAQQFNRRLFEEGIYATAGSPHGRPRQGAPAQRRSPEHTTDELQTALDAFARIGRELRLI
ncbi:MAG: hypothetical protein U0869_14570 [Chloroflexota bacterium]